MAGINRKNEFYEQGVRMRQTDAILLAFRLTFEDSDFAINNMTLPDLAELSRVCKQISQKAEDRIQQILAENGETQ